MLFFSFSLSISLMIKHNWKVIRLLFRYITFFRIYTLPRNFEHENLMHLWNQKTCINMSDMSYPWLIMLYKWNLAIQLFGIYKIFYQTIFISLTFMIYYNSMLGFSFLKIKNEHATDVSRKIFMFIMHILNIGSPGKFCSIVLSKKG